jgi:hypothetical protein
MTLSSFRAPVSVRDLSTNRSTNSGIYVLQTSPPEHIPGFKCRATGEQLLPLWPLQSAGVDLLDLGDDLPTPSIGVFTHGLDLKRERLLVIAGDAGV